MNFVDPVVAIIGALLVVIQIYFNLRYQRAENTHRLLEFFNTQEARLYRFKIGDILDEAEKAGNDFSILDDEKTEVLSAVAAMFGYAGILAAKRRVDTKLFLKLWGNVTKSSWEKLEPYRAYRKEKHGDLIGHWQYFEWLNKKASL